MEQADSLAVDPHKWLYVPFAAGCVFVRDAGAMERSFAVAPAYLRLPSESPLRAPVYFSDRGIQLSREFHALKIWVTLKHHGRRGLVAAIEHDLRMAALLAGSIEAAPDFELLAPRELSIVCFRYLPADLAAIADREPVRAYLDALNERILVESQRDGRVFLSSTRLGGRYALRACLINFRTEPEDLRFALQTLREIGAAHDHAEARAEAGIGPEGLAAD